MFKQRSEAGRVIYKHKINPKYVYIWLEIFSITYLSVKLVKMDIVHEQILNSLRPNDAYICVGKLTIIGLNNGLSPGRRQAIIRTNTGIWLIENVFENIVSA